MEVFLIKKVKEVFGESYELVTMERLLGGAQKYTYVAKCTNGFEFVIYQWDESKTYFSYDEDAAVFRSSSAVLFEENNRLMLENGVLTPKLYFMDRSRSEQNYDHAFAEYIDGVDMDHIMTEEPERMPEVIESLTASINKLHQIKSTSIGQADRMQDASFDLLAFTLEGIRRDCAYLKENDGAYKMLYTKALDKAEALFKSLSKRQEYTFIHAELGPNHVMVDQGNHAYLIDIEGAKYCDVEEENSFLEFRFEHRLKKITDVVEADRMLFYHIKHCFGILRGTVELKQKDYYDMDDLNGMIDFFHGQFESLGEVQKEFI